MFLNWQNNYMEDISESSPPNMYDLESIVCDIFGYDIFGYDIDLILKILRENDTLGGI